MISIKINKLFAKVKDTRTLVIFCLGFVSGLPLLLTLSTLSYWLATVGINKTAIGLFALVGIPYSLKFLWSPFLDQISLPILSKWLGNRRGWILFTQILVMISMIGLGRSNPEINVFQTAIWATLLSFCSASQDIVIDGYRVEIERDRGVGSSAIQLGYRLGMLISGAGAIYLSVFFQWSQVFQIMASLMLVGSITVFLSPKSPEDSQKNISSTEGTFNFVKEWFLQNVLEPFREFITRRFSFTIIIFIILYKLGDAVLGVMANPFYIEIGFSAQQIATASKVFGSLATIAGVIVGGLLTSSIGIFKSLLICGVLQALSNLMFVFQSIVGNDFSILFLTIGIENLSGGMGAAAFVAFLSSLCNRSHIITQYALLTSLMAFGRTTLSATGGWLADHLSWPIFFLLSSFLAIPGLLILLLLMRKIRLFLPDKTNQI